MKFSARWVSTVHTICAYSAFGSALLLGLLLHYKKIVKNEVAGYPQEWFPSVSATIGDWYPERSVFQILIALASGPRFSLNLIWYYVMQTSYPNSSLPAWTLIAGLVRTVSCGGWVYITSTDDHDAHDVLMILYIVLNLPWMIGSVSCSSNPKAKRQRTVVASTFFFSLIPMIYFFVQHKVQRVPGAYTRYAFFEWSLIILDVFFDSITSIDFEPFEVSISLPSGSAPTDKPSVDEKTFYREQTPVPSIVVTEAPPEPAADDQISIFKDYRQHITFLVDIYMAFMWWTTFTALTPSLFYYSVWQLGITGSELTLLALLSPYILSNSTLKRYWQSKEGRNVISSFEFIGALAWLSPMPGLRLIMVTFAAASANIRLATQWTTTDDGTVNGLLVVLGLIMHCLSKLVNDSNNPFWPIVKPGAGGWNKTGTLLSLLALAEIYYRPPPPPPRVLKEKVKSPISYLAAQASCGAMTLAFHSLLSSAETLIAFTWTGYPISGPIAGVHGPLVLIAMSLGLCLSRFSVVEHPAYIALGGAALYTLHHYSDWLGFIGGLGYAAFVCSSAPSLIRKAVDTIQKSQERAGSIVGHVFLSYILVALADVWTVAYAFVPGGFLLREKTYLVLGAQFLCIAYGLVSNRSPIPSSRAWQSPRISSWIYSGLALIVSLATFSTLSRIPTQTPTPYLSPERAITAGIWTVHFGIDLEGRDSQRRMRDLVMDMGLDVLGLLETDLHRTVFGNRDLTKIISELPYYVDVGPGPNKHTWGAVLLSKFPIINSTHHLLPSPDGELAPAISAYVDAWGTPVLIVVAHNGQEETPVDRELQSKALAKIMADAYPTPTIFLGYVVTKPHAARPAPYRILVEDGRVHDIDKDDMERWCEYILYRGLYRIGYGRVSRSTVTDTELQIGRFLLPPHGQRVKPDLETEENRYMRIRKETLPQRLWFNDSYYGSHRQGGVRGHYWHVFGTPLYYNAPFGSGVKY